MSDKRLNITAGLAPLAMAAALVAAPLMTASADELGSNPGARVKTQPGQMTPPQNLKHNDLRDNVPQRVMPNSAIRTDQPVQPNPRINRIPEQRKSP